jgi:enamine deaminase RidA (YjgF/YER057c/UK114 family)
VTVPPKAYLVSLQYIAAFREVRTELFRKIYPDGGFPPNTLVVVDRLVSEDFLVEIEAIAAVGPRRWGRAPAEDLVLS